jgi:hypothetical protein
MDFVPEVTCSIEPLEYDNCVIVGSFYMDVAPMTNDADNYAWPMQNGIGKHRQSGSWQ